MATIASQLRDRSVAPSDEQEQLLKLFWNRAELKKEFDKLRNDTRDLTDRLRRQEAMTLRVQQRFEQIEAQLANPETAQRATTFYQLRSVWLRCNGNIASTATDLLRAHYESEHREYIAIFRRKVKEAMVPLQRESNHVNNAGEELSSKIRSLRNKRESKGGAWHFFSRRRLTAEINEKCSERSAITMRLGELTAELNARAGREAPEFAGVSVAAKRLINLNVIAYTQELYLHFAEDDLARLAREAAAREVSDVRYGDHRDCRLIRRRVEERVQQLDVDREILNRVRNRARFLAGVVEYRTAADTVPVASALGSIVRLNEAGENTGNLSSVNVASDEYWDLFSVLLE
jgi:hypothetical protein